ncbi:hypothetical protein [Pantoea sp. GD03673]|uniref:hypothetical protein n=1 Tax=Pantoea sp. GD03673 TaxID=2975364 RepID=UPI00244A4617|nr:hypothetical protein [Pantoea sp. GD03673]MDH2066245.1 hypothetical protein [Pantoea sp. GD03673]
MSAVLSKFSFPVPMNKAGQVFGSAEELLAKLGGESSGQYLVGRQGMWHGGIHITHETAPWCALSTDREDEQAFCNNQPYKGEQFIRCMADGEIVAYRVCKDYDSAAISWNGGRLHMSNAFVLVKHYIQPGDTAESGLTFYTLYMNLAPLSAYTQTGSELTRTVVKKQRYYASAVDTAASKIAGTLKAGTVLTLSGNIISRNKDHRQFTEGTLVAETTNEDGIVLAVGTKVWTVSDRGALSTANSVEKPSWWAQCSPAYGLEGNGQVEAATRKVVKYYLSSDDVQSGTSAGKLAAGFPLRYPSGNSVQQVIRPIMTPGTSPPIPSGAVNTFSLVTLDTAVGNLKTGDRVWAVSDEEYLAVTAAASSGEQPVFGDVVLPATPIAIRAGDSIGHMGFYELPTESGKVARYQVHVECLSISDVAEFITNPGKVGEDKPAFLMHNPEAVLYAKNAEGVMVATSRKTRSQGIVTLSKVSVVKEGDQSKYYQIRQEGGWIAASDAQLISQYALADRGFVTLDKSSASFDLIDGKLQPDNIVKDILSQLKTAAEADNRPGYALNQHNYQRLLAKIDSNNDGRYSIEEYLQALNIVSYRDRLQRIIARHPSEWYFGKDDPLWKTYLDTLTGANAKWKTYLETFIEQMSWMKKVPGMEPAVWHMHPVVFLSALEHQVCDCEVLYADKFKVTRYGSVYGPIYKGSISLKDYSRWDVLISQGKLTSDEKEILIAMSENEGNMDALQSYDSEVITAGAMQKTVKDTFKPNADPAIDLRGKGELSAQFAKFKNLHPELYCNYAVSCGWTVEGEGSSAVLYYSDSLLTNSDKITGAALKGLIRNGCTQEKYGMVVHNKPLASLLKVILLPEYQDIQVLDFIDRLHSAENKVVKSSFKIRDFVKSKFGRAVVLDHSVNRPANVVRDFKKAIDKFYENNSSVNSDPTLWGSDFTKNESDLLNEYKLTRKMTDSVGRFNSLKGKL